ncbi:MAG TPA: zinc-dependent alcohol dehydrogenase family protein [Pseudonocardiaceae bacterium]|jgi:NADPH:quinone reductase-like Zn-dependent oxidoreductase|nr:zinc-dependent alcohol dehydrogenase family protein [Pseudonocardiaceae bacterium]
MRAIQITAYGEPREVLHVVDLPEPAEPGNGEVLVGVEFSPLNFHDLNLVKGLLPKRPPLPLVPGNEGVARVLRAGPDVTDLAPGDRIALPLLSGAWRERLVISTVGLSPLPDADAKQLSMIVGNPPTASLALSEYAPLGPGDWIVQNSANGGVGRSLIAIAKRRGIKTANIVRRADAVAELVALGADVVVVNGPDTAREIRQRIGADTPLPVAVDSIGGDAADPLLELLSPGGTLVFYSNATGKPVDIDGPVARSKNLTATKLFVGAFDRQTTLLPLIEEAAAMVASGEINTPIEAVYPLAEISSALDHLYRGGKILLEIDPAGS